ncbi:MAG: L-type lectin family protein [Methylovulum sp.]|nr:L-type lectin family protein [Methylovulum sp.]
MQSLLNKVGLTTLMIWVTHSASALTYNGFADVADLQLNGSAAKHHAALRLTSSDLQYFQSGSAFHKTTLSAAKFSSFFKFRITQKGGYISGTKTGGDGFVFVIQPISPTAIGDSGGHMGYAGITGGSVAVEFDGFQNTNSNDPVLPHVAIDVNGSTIHDGTLPVRKILPGFNDGRIWYAWIDYDSKTLTVRVSPTAVRPVNPQLKKELDIPTLLGNVTDAYVGFTAGTGGFWENHDILYWEYREAYQPVEVLGGIGDRMQAVAVTCQNLDTNQIVEIPAAKTNAWDCEKAGFVGHPGNNTVITIKGTLK